MTHQGKIEQNYYLTFMLSCYSINNIIALYVQMYVHMWSRMSGLVFD